MLDELSALAPRTNARLAAALVRVSLERGLRDKDSSRMIRIGTSGWSYDHWTDVLYPPGLPVVEAAGPLCRRVRHRRAQRQLLPVAARTPRSPVGEQRLPEGFTMSVKAHRGLTHFRRLQSPEPWVERFERCLERARRPGRGAAGSTAPRAGTRRRAAGAFLWACMPDSIPVAMELRHPSWNDPAVFSLLERHRAAYVVMSGAGLRVYHERPATWSTSGCTDRRRPRCTPAPTPKTTCAGGPSV